MKPYIVFRYGEDLETGPNSVLNITATKAIATIAGSTVQATVGVTLNSDGTITYNGAGSPGSWHNAPAAGVGASYWAILTVTSGTVTSGTTGSRVALTAGQGWTLTTTGSASIRVSTVSGTIQIWDAASGGNKVSEGNFSISAQVQATSTISVGSGGDTDFSIREEVPNEQL